MKEIRDPIHGFINPTVEESKIIDTNVFQRLRRIKQLAMAYLVYPGAWHTRFEHSLGVMHIAGRIAEKLKLDQDLTRIIRLAALLHDIGHGPFSHVSENILKLYKDVKSGEDEEIHEKIGWKIIENDPDLVNIIKDQDREMIIDTLSGKLSEPIAHEIVSGPLDADKQDYLLRDSYFCGVKYGVFDLERLIDTFDKIKDHVIDKDVLAITSDGIFALEQYIIAKYHMNTQVYRHKVRLVTDAMIVRAIELGIDEDKIDWLTRLYQNEDTNEYIKNYRKWDDNRLINNLLDPDSKNGYAKNIFKNLHERKLFKRIYSKSLNEFSDPDLRKYLESLCDNSKKREIERHLAEAISTKLNNVNLDPNLLILQSYKIKSVRTRSSGNEGSIMINKFPNPVNFDNESTLFRSIDTAERDSFIEVYASISFSDDSDKRNKQSTCEEVIHDYFLNNILSDLGRRDHEVK